MNNLARKRTAFDTSAMDNNFTYMQYYERLLNIALSVFEWKNVPDTVDTRWLELSLLRDGKAVFFEDEVLGYLALRVAVGGPLNVYNIPINRRAFGNNDYQKQLTSEDSVLIYNNLAHTNNVLDLRMYAQRLYNFDRIIDVNANAQKTPILITCDEPQRLTLKNMYMQYDGNQPVIYGDKEWLIKHIDMSKLTAYDVWLAQEEDVPDYPYQFTMWQYTTKASIDGIAGYANLDISFIAYSEK